ncbi:MAG: hypothetical protein IT197_07310, partial [Acidimicrobiia bacterium]|nr:hypothetical protein [Acidimicrobiia bacterium]
MSTETPEAGAGGVDTQTLEPPSEGAATTAPAAVEAARREQRWNTTRDRLLFPLILPVAVLAVVLFFVLNVSRVFLAVHGNLPVIIATIVTLAILGGAAWISATPSARSGSLSVLMIGVAFLVLISGLTVLGHSQEKKAPKAAGPKAPTGPYINTLEVDALASLSFQAKEFTVPPGINRINYIDKGGTHTLLFDEPQFSYFRLAVPEGPATGKVDLPAGKYTIFCDVPGHRAAGMWADLKVEEGAPNTGPGQEGA